jgi:hypothetical protein
MTDDDTKPKIYNLNISVSVPGRSETVTMLKNEAEVRVKILEQELQLQYPEARVHGYAQLSEENYTYHHGSVYLMKWYKSQVPVVCRGARRHYHYNYKLGKSEETYVHTFAYVKNQNKVVRIKGDKPLKKITQELCRDGKLGEQCESCPSKFVCMTTKKE